MTFVVLLWNDAHRVSLVFFTDGRLGIGNVAPAYKIDVSSTQANGLRLITNAENNNNTFQVSSDTNVHRPLFVLLRTRGSSGTPSSPTTSDLMGGFTWQSFGAAVVTVGQMFAQASESHASGTNLGMIWELQMIPTGQTTLRSLFRFSGARMVYNEGAQDFDFRMEGSSLSHMFSTDAAAATENIALLAASLPNWQTMDRGVFMGDVSNAPTGNPASGGFLYVVSGALTWRGSAGTVTTIAAA